MIVSPTSWEYGLGNKGIPPPPPVDEDIERIRTRIVWICREIWRRHHPDEPPRGIAALINQLRNEGLVPAHQANMMLTVCGLRNVQVYERIPLGSRERMIASNAWAIISDWWEDSRTPKTRDKQELVPNPRS